jgi:hypothetical protein
VPAGEFTAPPVKDAWLTDLEPLRASQEYGSLKKNRSCDDNALTIAGTKFERGLGTHARSEIVYDASGYRLFEAQVGVDAEKSGAGTCTFEVWVDGKRVYDSGKMTGNDAAKRVSVPLDRARELRLVVTDAGDGITCDHADWCDARLLAK